MYDLFWDDSLDVLFRCQCPVFVIRSLYQSDLYFIPKWVKKDITVSTGRDDDGVIDLIDSIVNEQTDFIHRFKQFIGESSF